MPKATMKCSQCGKEGHSKNNKKFHPKEKSDFVQPPTPMTSMANMEKPISDICCPEGVIEGCLMTKEKRQEAFGVVSGGGGTTKMEVYQREKVKNGTGRPCPKTKMRINWCTNIMQENASPMKHVDGYDWTEDFDGHQKFNENDVFLNFKSVVGAGGGQTRTLRDECYKFVDAQLKYLLHSKSTNCFFANIFDGDQASVNMDKFEYQLNKPEFVNVKKYVYVGDLKGYFAWVKANAC
jgi:hypothetical protein